MREVPNASTLEVDNHNREQPCPEVACPPQGQGCSRRSWSNFIVTPATLHWHRGLPTNRAKRIMSTDVARIWTPATSEPKFTSVSEKAVNIHLPNTRGTKELWHTQEGAEIIASA